MESFFFTNSLSDASKKNMLSQTGDRGSLWAGAPQVLASGTCRIIAFAIQNLNV
jgi:hypothetical protein